MDDPNDYAWLDEVGTLPMMIRKARELVGVHELAGDADSPVILGWAKEVGVDFAKHYLHDAVPWCGLFMALVARRAGKTPPPNPLWALNWATFGEPAGQPCLGDVLTFHRPGGGHVALYVAQDAANFHVLGGNQSNRVCFTAIAKERLYAARRPHYMSMPASVKPYLFKGTSGAVLSSES